MDLFGYTAFSVVYIMVYWLAIDWRNENSTLATWDFYQYSIAGQFVFGGVIGMVMNSYELGLVLAIVLSFIFHAH